MAGIKNKYRFKGHESFVLREGWLNKGMEALCCNPRLFSENSGADELGVGVNMAKSIRYWMKCAGLLEEKKNGIFLSPVGRMIHEKDAYLEDIFSLWIIHCSIAGNMEMATVWNLFFNRFDAEEFQQEYLKHEMKRMVSVLPEVGNYSERSVEDDCDALLRMYTKQKEEDKTPEEKNSSPFAMLGLIRFTGGAYHREQPALNRVPEEVVWYLMPENRDAFSIDELLEGENSPGKLLNLKRNGLVELLERLAAKNVIEINRTAGLDMVYLKSLKNREEILSDYYE